MTTLLELTDAAKRSGVVPPFVLIVGTERLLAERAVHALRVAALDGGPSGFNEETFHGRELGAGRVAHVVAAARTLPMMAKRRFVLVRDLHLLPAKRRAKDDATEDDSKPTGGELDTLATYAARPCDTACVVVTTEQIDGRSKLAAGAKKRGQLYEARPLYEREVGAWAAREAKERGHPMSEDATATLVAMLGADLSSIDDALERISLLVGPGKPIDVEAVEQSVARLRVSTIWELVDAISARDAKAATTALGSIIASREPGLRVLAMIARQIRIVAKMRDKLAEGLAPQDAAIAAGAPPFKGRELAASAKRFSRDDLASAFGALASADRALKGSKVPEGVALSDLVLALCPPR